MKKEGNGFDLGLLGLGAIFLLGLIVDIKDKNEQAKQEAEETIRRKTRCVFIAPLTEESFRDIVINEAKGIKRLFVRTEGAVVYGTVTTVSGISQWEIVLDFNDFGSVTGKYWLTSENDDSSIPATLANRIASKLRTLH